MYLLKIYLLNIESVNKLKVEYDLTLNEVKTMTQTTISKEWLNKRNEEIQKEKEENSNYLQLKNGENIIKIDLSTLPIETTGKFGKKFVYQTLTEKNGKKLLLSASKTLDALIIKALSDGHNPFTLVKVGEGKETRYAIKELEE